MSISYRYHAVTPLASVLRLLGGPRLDHASRVRSLRHGPQPNGLDGCHGDRTPDTATDAARAGARRTSKSRSQRGQILVIFAGAMIALMALCAVVVDVAWYWTNNLRMQRAADAAALAGVVWLPGNQGRATTAARDEAAKNGYTNGVDGVVVTPT